MKSNVGVRPWRASDARRLAGLGDRLSFRTVTARFWTGMSELPATYLRSIEERWPQNWDAVVAVRDGQLIGWAEFGRNAAGSTDADAAFCVIDAEQGHGVGTTLMRALVAHAARAGISDLHADISADNAAALHAWRHATADLPASMALTEDGYRGWIAVPARTAPVRSAHAVHATHAVHAA